MTKKKIKPHSFYLLETTQQKVQSVFCNTCNGIKPATGIHKTAIQTNLYPKASEEHYNP